MSFDAAAAEKMPGVRVVRDGDLLAVVAPDVATARGAAAANHQANGRRRSADASEPSGRRSSRRPRLRPWSSRRRDTRRCSGAATWTRACSAAVRRKVSTYWLPPVAHVPLEPRAAIAEWNGGAVTIHCGVQAPFLVRQEVAQALGVPAVAGADRRDGLRRRVRRQAAGRMRGRGGAALAAGRRSDALAWTREEEFTCSYTRPAACIEVESGVDAERPAGRAAFRELQQRRGRPRAALRHRPTSGSASTAPAPTCGRAATGRSPPWPTPSRASRTWTSGPPT